MISEWLIEFNKNENQLIITEMAKKYDLSREEYINVINLMIYYYVIANNPNTLEAVTIICNKLRKYSDDISKHQNHLFFKDCLSIFLEKELETGNLNRVESFLNQGFLFHSFNGAFLPHINEKGLMGKDKPWNLEDVEQVKEIFLKKINKNIFGYYQGKNKTPLFFANNLLSSAYYGISSPTFFRKFIENNPKYFNVFLDRNYEKARESIEVLCEGLESKDKNVVLQFFQVYWDFFTSSDFPCIAISTKEKLNISANTTERVTNENSIDIFLNRLLATQNEMINYDIPREALEIFSYQTFSFIPYKNEKTYK